MAEKERQADNYKIPHRPDPSSAAAASSLPLRRKDILRAKDIIPGVARPAADEGVSNIDIPRFDLAEDIMAEQRRLTVVRRKGPGSPEPVNLTPSPCLPVAVRPSQSRHSFSEGFNDISDPLIADIVTRDIKRLCSGFRA
jgi:hypothetical protein